MSKKYYSIIGVGYSDTLKEIIEDSFYPTLKEAQDDAENNVEIVEFEVTELRHLQRNSWQEKKNVKKSL